MRLIFALCVVVAYAHLTFAADKIKPEIEGCFVPGEYVCEPDLGELCSAKEGAWRVTSWSKVKDNVYFEGELVSPAIWAPNIEYYCAQTGIWNVNTDLRHPTVVDSKNGIGHKYKVSDSIVICFKKGQCASKASEESAVLRWIAPRVQEYDPADSNPPGTNPPNEPLPLGWTPIYKSVCADGPGADFVGTTTYVIKNGSPDCQGKGGAGGAGGTGGVNADVDDALIELAP